LTARVRIGRVGRAQGVEGAFRVSETTERLELLASGRRVFVGDRPFTIAWRAGTPARPVLKLETMDDRDSAQSATGAPITVPRDEIGALEENEFLIDDLIGCEVTAGHLQLGSVADVLLLPSVEALVVGREREAELLVPLVDAAVESIDVEGRRIAVRPGFLAGDG
jgi:16S rRNA processing protein RimM